MKRRVGCLRLCSNTRGGHWLLWLNYAPWHLKPAQNNETSVQVGMIKHCIAVDSRNLSLGFVHKEGMFIRCVKTDGRRQFLLCQGKFPIEMLLKKLWLRWAKDNKLFWQVTIPCNQGCKWDTEGRINSAELQWYTVLSLLPPSTQLYFTVSPSERQGGNSDLLQRTNRWQKNIHKGFPTGFMTKDVIWVCLHNSHE